MAPRRAGTANEGNGARPEFCGEGVRSGCWLNGLRPCEDRDCDMGGGGVATGDSRLGDDGTRGGPGGGLGGRPFS